MTCSAVRCVGTVNLSERLPRSFGRSQTGDSLRPQNGDSDSCPRFLWVRPHDRGSCAVALPTLRGSFVRQKGTADRRLP